MVEVQTLKDTITVEFQLRTIETLDGRSVRITPETVAAEGQSSAAHGDACRRQDEPELSSPGGTVRAQEVDPVGARRPAALMSPSKAMARRADGARRGRRDLKMFQPELN